MFLSRFEEFTYVVSKIYRSIQKIKLDELQKYGLKGSHMSYIYCLGNNEDGLSFKEISELSVDNKGLVSRNLSYLLEKNIIVKNVDANKVYKGKFYLSKLGNEIFDNISRTTTELCKEVYLDKSESKIEEFYDNLNQISNTLDKILEDEQ